MTPNEARHELMIANRQLDETEAHRAALQAYIKALEYLVETPYFEATPKSKKVPVGPAQGGEHE